MESHNSKNLKKLIYISYLLPFITGIAVVLPFVIKSNVAQLLHASLSEVGYAFSIFMIGMIITQFLNGFFVKYIKLKTELYLIVIIYLLCVIAMEFITTTSELRLIVLVMGLCFGITTTVPNMLITNSFQGKDRTSKMNKIDLFFSIGSFVFPFIVGWLFAYNFDWVFIYATVLIIWFILVAILINTDFPNLINDDCSEKNYSKWDLNVFLIAFAIFFYFVSYTGFTYWIEPFLQKEGIPVQYATQGVSLFWFFYGVGCLISSIVVNYIRVERYIIFSAIVSLICYIAITCTLSINLILIITSVLGLGCSTIFSSGISYGTLVLEKPSPSLVAFFIGSSGIGTYIGEYYSSFIYSDFGFNTLTITSGVAMLLTIILVLIVAIRKKDLNTLNANLTH